jgi:creatinine amidohydrolase
MKKRSVYFPEMTRKEIEAYIESAGNKSKVILPVGSTEQHGTHLPVSTDTLIVLEVSRRTAPEIEALIAPPIVFGLSDDHRPAGGVISIKMNTLSILIKDVVLSLSEQGFQEIIALNGHYTNAWTILHSINEIQQQLPKGTIAFGLSYWDALTQDQAADFISMKAGVHANHAETASVLAIDESLVDMDAAPNEWPTFPKMRTSVLTILNSYFLTRPGAMIMASKSGSWGDTTKATAADGGKLLEWFTRATVNMIGDIEDTFRHFPGSESQK